MVNFTCFGDAMWNTVSNILCFEAGSLYRDCYGEHVGFAMFWDTILGWLARKGQLPDLEIMVNLGN
jgi:hypothetical protein